MKDYWMISLGAFCRYGIFAAVQALWAGPFLIEVMKYSNVVTGNLLLLLNIGLIIGGPFLGVMSDSILKSRKIVIVTGLMGIATPLAVLAVLPQHTPVFIVAFLFWAIGFFSSAGFIMYPHIKELMPFELSGTATTGINLFNMGGAAVFLQGLGILMEWLIPRVETVRSAFGISFGLCSIFLTLTAVLYALGTRETLKRVSK
jgi:sugar phosphate permease